MWIVAIWKYVNDSDLISFSLSVETYGYAKESEMYILRINQGFKMCSNTFSGSIKNKM